MGPVVDPSTVTLSERALQCAEILSDFYSTVFTRESLSDIPFVAPRTQDELTHIEFTVELLSKNLRGMKSYSFPRPDGIPYIILKCGGSFLLSKLSIIFQKFFNAAKLPVEWKTAYVTPIFKKGNRKEAENYRPVSLGPV